MLQASASSQATATTAVIACRTTWRAPELVATVCGQLVTARKCTTAVRWSSMGGPTQRPTDRQFVPSLLSALANQARLIWRGPVRLVPLYLRFLPAT